MRLARPGASPPFDLLPQSPVSPRFQWRWTGSPTCCRQMLHFPPRLLRCSGPRAAAAVLMEDPALAGADPLLHHSILGAIASGSVTGGRIASRLGRQVSNPSTLNAVGSVSQDAGDPTQAMPKANPPSAPSTTLNPLSSPASAQLQ